jgi:hypothetical protein
MFFSSFLVSIGKAVLATKIAYLSNGKPQIGKGSIMFINEHFFSFPNSGG